MGCLACKQGKQDMVDLSPVYPIPRTPKAVNWRLEVCCIQYSRALGASPPPLPLMLPAPVLTPASRKKKGLAGRLASNSVRIVVAVLLLIAFGGWLHSHKHKVALHRSLGETVGKMNTATQERGACHAAHGCTSPGMLLAISRNGCCRHVRVAIWIGSNRCATAPARTVAHLVRALHCRPAQLPRVQADCCTNGHRETVVRGAQVLIVRIPSFSGTPPARVQRSCSGTWRSATAGWHDQIGSCSSCARGWTASPRSWAARTPRWGQHVYACSQRGPLRPRRLLLCSGRLAMPPVRETGSPPAVWSAWRVHAGHAWAQETPAVCASVCTQWPHIF